MKNATLMKHITVSLFSALCLSACAGGVRTTELSVIDLEAAMSTGRQLPDTFALNDIVEVTDIIPIETRSDALIGWARIIHIGREHYYVAHEDKLSRIARDGRIASTISRQGRGPGEYLMLATADVNEEASTIRIFDLQGDKFITYDMDGTTIDESLLNRQGIWIPEHIAADHMVAKGHRESTHRLYITDRDMNIRQGFFPIDSTLSAFDRWGLTQQVAIGRSGDEALINTTRGDTLYRVTRLGELIPEAILRKGRYQIPDEPLIPIFRDVDPTTTQYIHHATVNSLGDHYFVEILMFGQAGGIWDKATGQLLAYFDSRDGFDNLGFRFVFPSDGGEAHETRVSAIHFDDNRIAFVVDAINAVGAIEGVQEDDNPVIVIAKLK